MTEVSLKNHDIIMITMAPYHPYLKLVELVFNISFQQLWSKITRYHSTVVEDFQNDIFVNMENILFTKLSPSLQSADNK